MKRFWLVLLSLGLIVAFSTSAMAVDVKFSGEYYAAGLYLDKTGFRKTDAGVGNLANSNPSTAFYFQRLRVKTDFVVSPGLTLTTRADIMERAWGAARTAAGVGAVTTGATPGGMDTLSAGTRAENENIAFDWAYLTYVSPIGAFTAGYQNDRAWGTVFGDNSYPNAKITYTTKIGDLALGAQIGKDNERSVGTFASAQAGLSDNDRNFYNLFARYGAKTWEAGILFKYVDDRTGRLVGNIAPFRNKLWAINSLPYAKAKIGPIALQTELQWSYGQLKVEDEHAAAARAAIGNDKMDVNQLSAWVDATADFGKFYVGGTLAYASGDDPDTNDKVEGGLANGGLDWQPCLIMFNSDRSYWAGNPAGYGGTANGAEFANGYLAQFRGGVRPTEQFDIMASFSYAKADKTLASATWEGRDYGYEIDVTGTYKITNNLSYMLGAGYLMTGNYYKAATSTNRDLADDFMVINKLTLTF